MKLAMIFRNEFFFTKSKKGAIISSRTGRWDFGSATMKRADLNNIGKVTALHRLETEETFFKLVTSECVSSNVGSSRSVRRDDEGLAVLKYSKMLVRSSLGRLSIVTGDLSASVLGDFRLSGSLGVGSASASRRVLVSKATAGVSLGGWPVAVAGDILAAVLMYVCIEQ